MGDTLEILFITSDSVGDAIISTGILGYLMDEYPEAQFTIAAATATLPLFEQCPRVVRVISMFKLPWNKHWLKLWKETRHTHWDLIVDLRSTIIAHILNADNRKVFKNPDKLKSRARQLADLLGLKQLPPTRLWASDDVRTQAHALLPKDKTLVVLAPKSNSSVKDWPIDRFVELARRLYKEDMIFVVMASALQHQAIQPFFRTMPASQVLDLSGKTDLPTAYAVISEAKLLIGNDSGLLHMAAAAGTPAVGIYGPTNDKTYAPHSDKIRIVTAIDFQPGEEEKQESKYIQMITVDKVEAAVRELGVL